MQDPYTHVWNNQMPQPNSTTPLPMTSAYSTIHLVMFPAAQEYFDKAHRQSTKLKSMEDVMAYYKLIATGTRCLEVVLKERIQPYVECIAALRYCEAIFTESKEFGAAEEVLNKAIVLAARNNFHDLKFSMLDLSIRMLATKNLKAAQKLLKSCLREADTIGIASWSYTFQYLSVSLYFSADDYTGATNTLKSLYSCSSNELRYMAFLTSALVAIRQNNPSHARDCISQAVQCETDYSRQYIPQLVVMRLILETITTILLGDVAKSEAKLKAVHDCLDGQVQDQSGRWTGWNDDGTFFLFLPSGSDGNTYLPLKFKWWSQPEVYVMSYLISGIVSVHSSWDKKKSSKYFSEGLHVIATEIAGNDSPEAPLMTITQAAHRADFYATAKCYTLFYTCLERFVRGDWSSEGLQALVDAAKSVPTGTVTTMYPLILYVCGLYFQATGKLRSALEAYALIRRIQPQHSELSMMASLGMIIIYRGDVMSNPEQASILGSQLRPVITNSPNQAIKFAWALASAVDGSQSGIDMQNNVVGLLTAARDLANSQFTTIIMHLGASIFSEQEKKENTAMGAFLSAKKTRDVLWCWVSGNLAADMLQQSGKDLMAEKQSSVNKQIYNLVDNLLNSQPPF
ncbi:cohesin loading factor [Lipomyces tetrasporus]|uniref:Cohesin loading factor n=1 Tax=Lipomyces tetrasporus TaxID=54092 RepID=A0AAD7VPU8_9ASCO|nr:cohesin loading factor [Lipomyces tetrasporus]KAJ8096849.1 cohesin loading factor [Lipomyces tetrasporus]